MKKLGVIIILVCGLILSLFSCSSTPSATSSEDEKFVDDLLSKMTLEEKIGQLNLPGAGDFNTGQAKNTEIGKKILEGKVGGLFNIKGVNRIKTMQDLAMQSRLRIPLIFGMDVIHGYETVFPIPLGLASSFDMGLIEKTARAVTEEVSAAGINWTFSPMVDICRDPRWGRVAEGNGEDPYLGSEIAKAMVKGYQGDDLSKNNTILACVKHYALYGAPEGGKDYNTVDMSKQRMYNDYFPPYKAAVDAGVGSAMASFNEVDGIPATGNRWLMTDVLRNEWGFKGFVVTDYTGINEMVAHGTGDLQTNSALALNAGVHMDMVGEGFLTTLKKSVEEGKVTEQQITEAARLILIAKKKLGLFDDPYRYLDTLREQTLVFTKNNREFSRQVAAQSMVLLKNKNVLPLKKQGTVAIIGPLANMKENMPGTWSVATKLDQAIDLLEGMKSVIGDKVKILHAKGSNLDYDETFENNAGMFGKKTYRDKRPKDVILNEALQVARQADVILATLGESAEMTGESSSRSNIEIPQSQKDLLNALVKTGKPIVLVLFTGRPLVLSDEVEKVDAILNVWFPGSEAGLAITDVLWGNVNPSGKLPITFPRTIGQVPIYYKSKNTGRPIGNKEGKFEKFRSNYLDVRNEPLFPFGFGLSYTSFEYSDISLSTDKLKGEQTLNASVTLKNTGKFDGAEVVQLYIRDKVGSVTRPVKELKGIQKVFLNAGESKEISFQITTEQLKFYNYNLKYDWEAGEFDIMIGTNSDEVKVKTVEWNK